MANPFDQFDAVVTPSGGNPFDQFDVADEPSVEPQGELAPASLKRGAGLAARTIAQLGTDIVMLPGDVVVGLVNTALGTHVTTPSESRDYTLDKLGLPTPETTTEKVVNLASRGAGGAAGLAKLAAKAAPSVGRVASDVLETIGGQQGRQAIAGATGSASAEVAREAGAGPVGQTVAGLAGGMAPSLATTTAAATTRGLLRGGEQGRQRVAENLETFVRSGTVPTVGQASEGRFAQATESALSRAPGGAGRMAATATKQADEIAARLEERAAKIIRKTSGEQTGRKIEQAVRGEGGFIERFRGQQATLFGKLDSLVPADSPVKVSATQKALADLTSKTKGAEAITGRLINPKIGAMADDLTKDAANGTVPYEALKQLRTRIGQEISDASLTSDVPKSQWKRLYGALSDDLAAAAKAAGPQAEAAFTRANTFTRAGMKRIEAIESVIERAGGPEKIFSAATANTKEGATTLRSLMQSLDDEGKRMITATVVRRLGLGKAGVQSDLGDRFSTESFLTNWNLLSPAAKRTLFDRYGPKFRADMDQVAKLAANLRSGSQVFRNPSGTAQAVTQGTTAGAFVVSALTGQVGLAATIASTVAASNALARAMTNPRFVRWLAQTTTAPLSAYSAQVNTLANIARGQNDEDLALVAAMLEEQKPDQQPNQPNN